MNLTDLDDFDDESLGVEVVLELVLKLAQVLGVRLGHLILFQVLFLVLNQTLLISSRLISLAALFVITGSLLAQEPEEAPTDKTDDNEKDEDEGAEYGPVRHAGLARDLADPDLVLELLEPGFGRVGRRGQLWPRRGHGLVAVGLALPHEVRSGSHVDGLRGGHHNHVAATWQSGRVSAPRNLDYFFSIFELSHTTERTKKDLSRDQILNAATS